VHRAALGVADEVRRPRQTDHCLASPCGDELQPERSVVRHVPRERGIQHGEVLSALVALVVHPRRHPS
jgi:hypothetical protein